MRCSSAMPAGMSTSSVAQGGLHAAALAGRTGRDRDLALAAADVARLGAHHLAECRAGNGLKLARAAAALAGLDRGAGLGAVAVAALARLDGVEGDLDLRAARRLLERDLHLHAHVAPLHRARPAGPAEGVAAEERLEDVGERAEAVRLRRVPARVQAIPAVAVVDDLALGIGQHLVRLGGLLELLLGRRVVSVHVGVQLVRERTEGLLHLPLVSAPGDAEHLVGVAPHSS